MTIDSVPTGRRRIAGERSRTASEASTRRPSRDDAPANAAVRRRTTRWTVPQVPLWLVSGLAVVLAAVLVFDVVLTVRHQASSSRDRSEAAALSSAFNTAPAQAEKAAEQVLSYGYDTLQADADAAKAFLTPTYAATFQKTVDDFLAKPASDAEGRVTAKVMASGVVAATPGQVDVLVFVDQLSTTKQNAKGQTALNRVVFSMVREGGRWLVDDVTAL